MTSVAVMMSVYNGEAFIAEQVESILSQVDVDVSLFIRDDGSGPAARAILAKFAAEHPNVRVTHGENLGITKSFLQIVDTVPETYDYYAFSDGDDVWLPRKLATAVACLETKDQSIAQAYCSQITLVTEDLRFIAHGHPLRRQISFANALVECRMSGATAVFNPALILHAKSLDHSAAIMHDSWMNLLAATFGEVHFDPSSYILYRQHGRNADGGQRSALQIWRDRLGRRGRFTAHARQAEALADQIKGQIPIEKEEALLNLRRYDAGNLSVFAFLKDRKIVFQRTLSKLFIALAILGKIK